MSEGVMTSTVRYSLRDSVNVENWTMDVITPSDIYMEGRYSLKGRMIRVFPRTSSPHCRKPVYNQTTMHPPKSVARTDRLAPRLRQPQNGHVTRV